MGYDMYWEQQPEDMKQEYEQARAAFMAAVNERDTLKDVDAIAAAHEVQEKVELLYEEMAKKQRFYFRLNIWGMGYAREMMWKCGMLSEEGYEDFESVLESDTGGKIPVYKLGSNDGWLVTPEEIRRSLEALENGDNPLADEVRAKYERGGMSTEQLEAELDVAHGRMPFLHDGEPVEWWPEWVKWLRDASEHGGFRVY